MGMYDRVSDGNKPLELECPVCGQFVTDFQSKDGPCHLVYVDYRELRNFYSSCGNCKTWLEYKQKPLKAIDLDDYICIEERPEPAPQQDSREEG